MSECIDAEETHCLCLWEQGDEAPKACCHCGITADEYERLFDPGPEVVVEPPPLPVMVCGTCNGRAWSHSLFPCRGCGGSGIEGMTAREAYLREFPPAKS